jgi:hypothetical protein
MAKKWTKIADSKIRMVWKCPDCGLVLVIDPTFYQDNGFYGTPVCECDSLEDMVYVRTEILE